MSHRYSIIVLSHFLLLARIPIQMKKCYIWECSKYRVTNSLLFEFSQIQGAATTCYAALHPSLKGVTGKYFLDCNEFEPSALASNELLGKKLWDFSNKLINQVSKDWINSRFQRLSWPSMYQSLLFSRYPTTNLQLPS